MAPDRPDRPVDPVRTASIAERAELAWEQIGDLVGDIIADESDPDVEGNPAAEAVANGNRVAEVALRALASRLLDAQDLITDLGGDATT